MTEKTTDLHAGLTNKACSSDLPKPSGKSVNEGPTRSSTGEGGNAPGPGSRTA